MTLPSSWSFQRLDNIANLSRGKFSARPRNDPRFFGGDIPFVQTGDVRNAHVYLREFTQTLNGEGLKVSRVFPQGTMLFTIAANIGDLAFLSFDAACPDSLVAIEPKQDVDAIWLFYQLGAFKADFEAAATQNAQLNINLEKLNPFKIPCPPLHEQQAIAAALSDADGVVAGLERVIAKKRLIKQGAMQDLLTARRRLPGFSGEWEVKRLGAFGRTYGGLTGKSKQDFGIGVDSYIEFMDVMQNITITGGEFPKVRVGNGERQNRVLRNDLLFNGSSETPEEVGLCAAVLTDLENTYLNSFCFGYRMTEDNQVFPAFMASLIRSGEGRERIKHLAQGATRYNLSKRALLELELPLPSFEEQQAIAAVLSDMDAEIQTLESRLTKARAVKEGMMQNLLTGRVRLV